MQGTPPLVVIHTDGCINLFQGLLSSSVINLNDCSHPVCIALQLAYFASQSHVLFISPQKEVYQFQRVRCRAG